MGKEDIPDPPTKRMSSQLVFPGEITTPVTWLPFVVRPARLGVQLSEENKVCLCAKLTDPFTNPTNQTHHISLPGTSHRPTQQTVPSHVGANPSAHRAVPPRADFSADPPLRGLESVLRAQPGATTPCTLGLALLKMAYTRIPDVPCNREV